MNTFLTNTGKEFYKLRNRKKYLVFIILGLLVILVRTGGSMLITKLSGGTVVIRSNTALEMLRFLVEILVPLIIFMASTDLISTQLREDTLKADLLRPVTRLKLLLSKISAIMLMAIIYFAVFFAGCLAVQLIFGGSVKFIGQTFLAYVLDLIPLVNVVLLAVLINLVTVSPSLSMVLCIGVYLVMKYCSYYVSAIGQVLFTSYAQWHNLWIGTTVPFSSMIGKIGILAGTMLILFSVSYIVFEKKDV